MFDELIKMATKRVEDAKNKIEILNKQRNAKVAPFDKSINEESIKLKKLIQEIDDLQKLNEKKGKETS